MKQVGLDLWGRLQPVPPVTKPSFRRWITPVCMAVILVVYLSQIWYYHHYVNDDAYITFRYSHSLADGLGPFYNPGEHVEGYTSLSMMLLVTGAIRLLGEGAAPVAAKAIGVLFGAFCIVLTFLFTRYLGRRMRLGAAADSSGLIAAALVALNPAFALNSNSGLETTLFAFLLFLGAALAVLELSRHTWHGSGIVFALALLTRPEGILLFGLFWTAQAGVQLVDHMRRRQSLPAQTPSGPYTARRLLILNGLIVASVLTVHLALRYLTYDGEWLPNTYYAKLGGLLHEHVGAYIAEGVLPAFFGPLGLTVALAGLALRCRDIWRFLPLVAIAGTGCLLPLWTGKDWMPGHRLVMPYLPLAACLVTVGWASLLGRVAHRRTWIRISVLIVAIGGLFYLQNGERDELRRYVEIRSAGYQSGHIALAHWLNDQTNTEGGSVALMDIGMVGYYCPSRDIVDITGLTDRFIAMSAGGFLTKDYNPGYILDQHPEFIVLTLTASLATDDAPPSPTSLTFWTPIERRLYYSPEFQKSYLSHRQQTAAGDDDYSAITRQFGAERIFEHAYPGAHYLLAVFRQQQPRAPADHHASVLTP